uniref:Uncharacterized protein n=1 Tax=Magallana gigas TaxID=29159 RepID=K1QVE6_MAGGI
MRNLRLCYVDKLQTGDNLTQKMKSTGAIFLLLTITILQVVFFGCASSQNVTTASVTAAAPGSTLSVTASVTTGNGTDDRDKSDNKTNNNYVTWITLEVNCDW